MLLKANHLGILSVNDTISVQKAFCFDYIPDRGFLGCLLKIVGIAPMKLILCLCAGAFAPQNLLFFGNQNAVIRHIS